MYSNLKANAKTTAILALVAIQFLLSSCGGGSATTTASAPPPAPTAAPNPAPTANSVNPANATAGTAGVHIIMDGANFVSGAIMTWNGTNIPTTFASSTQVSADVPQSALTTSGTAQVKVTNPAPGGGASNALTFTIANPAPIISVLSSNSALVGATSTVSIQGSNFLPTSTVLWNGSTVTATYVSTTELQTALSASQTATAGAYTVQVSNPAPGGGASNQLSFTVLNGSPVVSGLTPTSAPAGGASVTLTISGSGFVPGSSVEWNGTQLATTFVSNTTLQAIATGNELATVGSYSVRVSNPLPGGGSSAGLSFTVDNGVPAITSISKTNASAGVAGFASVSITSAFAGEPGFTITVDGANFVAGSLVLWNGAALQTTFLSSVQLTVEVTADKVAQAGTSQLMVWNPPPSGGFSSSVAFVVDPVTSNFVYVAQPVDGLISRLLVDPVSKRLRPDGYDYVVPGGSGLWAMHLHRSRKFLYALDFSNNQVLGFAINPVSGDLKAIPGATVSTGTEPVYVTSHPSGKYLYVTNLSSGDVSGYSVDQNTGALQAITGSPFAAGQYPLGIITDDAGKFVFVTNYGSSTISVFAVSASGSLVPVAGSPFPAAGAGPWTPALDPSGKFLFVPNYDSADVSVYTINTTTGSLSAVSGSPYKIGTFPSYVSIDPSGRFLYVSDSNDNVQGLMHILAVNAGTGQLSATSGSPIAAGASPNRLMFSNSGSRAFLTNYSSWDLMTFDVNPQDGSLTKTETLSTRINPENLAILEGGTPYSVAPKFAYSAQPAGNQISVFQVDPANGSISVAQTVNSVTADALAIHPASGFVYSLATQAGAASAFQINPSNGTLTASPIGPMSVGTDPRAIVFEPTKRFAYVLNKSVGKISQYAVDASTGAFTPQGTTTIGAGANSMAVGPTGRYLYVAFPNTSEIKFFEITATDGSLGQPTSVNMGVQGPSQIATDPYGKFLAATFPSSGEVRLFEIFAPTGELNYKTTVFPGSSPTAVAFDPSGKFLLATDSAANTITVYSIGPSGQLGAIGTSATGNGPSTITIDPSNRFVYVGNAGSADISVYQFDPQSGSLQIANNTVLTSSAAQFIMVGAN